MKFPFRCLALGSLILAEGIQLDQIAVGAPTPSNDTIPFQLASEFLIVPKGQIGSLPGLVFILDTGATNTMVDDGIADRLLLPRHKGGASPFSVASRSRFQPNLTVTIAEKKTGGAIMNWKHWISLLAVVAASTAMAGPKGTAPRSAPDKYRTHAEREGVAIGAELLSSSQTRNIFTSDVSHSCLVVEVAFYPQKDKPLHISLDDFTLQAAGKKAAQPLRARAVAATIQDRNEQTRQVVTTQSVGVGYESGTVIDPMTGRPEKVHGVTTRTDVGVGIGDSDARPLSSREREIMEAELSEMGLPEGDASAPVSGYLYFPFSAKKKGTALQLKYILGDQPVVLTLPQ